MVDNNQEIRESRLEGRYYDSDKIHIISVLIVAGHKVHEYTQNRFGRLVAWFPYENDGGVSIHTTIRDYHNFDLILDARKLIDTWMQSRDMTRNKRFIRGPSKA